MKLEKVSDYKSLNHKVADETKSFTKHFFSSDETKWSSLNHKVADDKSLFDSAWNIILNNSSVIWIDEHNLIFKLILDGEKSNPTVKRDS